MEEEAGVEAEEQVMQDNVTLPNELEITERMTEIEMNDESSIVRLSSYPSELQHLPEIATSVSDRASIHMHIFTTNNSSSTFSKKSLTRKSI